MSEQTKDGGPAFPCGPFGQTMHGEDGREWHQYDRLPGMSLRDWFAGQALAGMAASAYWSEDFGVRSETQYIQIVAKAAYDAADAMLERRGK